MLCLAVWPNNNCDDDNSVSQSTCVQQEPMFCLADVMKFFVSTVGPSARPLRCDVGSTRFVPTDVWSFTPEMDSVASRNRTERG